MFGGGFMLSIDSLFCIGLKKPPSMFLWDQNI